MLAERVRDLLDPIPAELNEDWGLDHGAWSVLFHIIPNADVPVVQLSIDRTKPPSFHHEIGSLPAQLRDEGVLLLGSGNLVHNLQRYEWDRPDMEPFEWALKFDNKVRGLVLSGKDTQLFDYQARIGSEAKFSAPTPDHYLPLLYVLGSRWKNEGVSFPVDGFDGGSTSMLAIRTSG